MVLCLGSAIDRDKQAQPQLTHYQRQHTGQGVAAIRFLSYTALHVLPLISYVIILFH